MNQHRVAVVDDTAEQHPAPFMDRVVRQLGLSSSAAAVYGAPVEHGPYTVVPVARVMYVYGAAMGPELAGRKIEQPAEGRMIPSLTTGGGAGGAGISRPAGHIEIGPAGTRFVPVRRDWRGPVMAAGVVGTALMLLRPPWRRGGR